MIKATTEGIKAIDLRPHLRNLQCHKDVQLQSHAGSSSFFFFFAYPNPLQTFTDNPLLIQYTQLHSTCGMHTMQALQHYSAHHTVHQLIESAQQVKARAHTTHTKPCTAVLAHPGVRVQNHALLSLAHSGVRVQNHVLLSLEHSGVKEYITHTCHSIPGGKGITKYSYSGPGVTWCWKSALLSTEQ